MIRSLKRNKAIFNIVTFDWDIISLKLEAPFDIRFFLAEFSNELTLDLIENKQNMPIV